MTVICFRNGVMAADGRVTEEASIFVDNDKKITRLRDGSLLGAAGDTDNGALADLCNRSKRIPSPKQLSNLGFQLQAILVKPDGSLYLLESDKGSEEDFYRASTFKMDAPFFAVGSGMAWAMGAMDRGATAEQAVKTAIKYCNTCGGKVQTMRLDKD